MSAPGARVLVVSEDDDVAEPLLAILRRAGYRVALRDGREGVEELRAQAPDVLIVDRDLAPDHFTQILDLLAPRSGAASFPLLILGGGAAPRLPQGWHEDAWASLGRPPQPGEVEPKVAGLLRLAFYRRYRDLVHDLAQPVTTLHALSRTLEKTSATEPKLRETVERVAAEAERLMRLMEEFQKRRG